jgi:hypothetical protein
MRIILFFVLSAVCFTACQQEAKPYVPKDLRKLSAEELIDRAKNRVLTAKKTPIIKNEKGEIIKIPPNYRAEGLANDAYVNKAGEIVEVVYRKATEADRILEDKIIAIVEANSKVKIIPIDCANKQSILQTVYERGVANKNSPKKWTAYHKNLEIVTSLLDKCGMPSSEDLSPEQYKAIWSAIYNADLNEYAKKYLPFFEKATADGNLDKASTALLKDKALLYENKAQLYGSIITEGKLWKLADPEYVNQRRAEVGLEPIEDYLKKHNIAFNTPQKN